MHIDSHYSANVGKISKSPRLTGKLTCQTCVIGGGLAGLTCARELVKAGHDVVLLEAKNIGWGASGRNGGLISAGFARSLESIARAVGWTEAIKLYELSANGRDYVRETIRALELDDVILGNSWLTLSRVANLDHLAKSRDFLGKYANHELELIPQRRLNNYVRSNRYFGGMLDRDAFHIDPLKYAIGLGSDIVNRKGKIFEETRCRSLAKNIGDGDWVIHTDNASVKAESVVLATSAYGGPYPALNQAILPVATYIVSCKPNRKLLDKFIPFTGAISDTRRSGDYYRTIGKGDQRRLLWGGRITTTKGQPAQLATMLKADMVRVYPEFERMVVERAWSGLMGYTRHQMPVIGPLEQGLWSATGFGGMGLNTTAMAGQLIANAICHGDDTYQQFDAFGAKWAGGVLGKIATQLEYWRLQALDYWDER